MCEVDYLNLGLSLPALRGNQGGREIYVTLPNNNVINTFFPTHVEGGPGTSQAMLDEGKVGAIESYITDRSDGFVLGAITYATDCECVFEEAVPGAQFGVLRLPLTAKLRSLDGHHRREALRSVVERINNLGNQHTALIIYVEPRLDRRRLMFADLNRPRSTNGPIAADRAPLIASRASKTRSDPFRVAADALAQSHPFLVDRVDLITRQGKRRQHEFDLADIERSLKRLAVGPAGRVKHPERFNGDVILERGGMLFDALLHADSDATHGTDTVLRWPLTLPVAAGATWVLSNADAERPLSAVAASKALGEIDYSPTGPIWTRSGLSDGQHPKDGAGQRGVTAAVDLLVHEVLVFTFDQEHGIDFAESDVAQQPFERADSADADQEVVRQRVNASAR